MNLSIENIPICFANDLCYTIKLTGKVVAVSLETVEIVEAFTGAY